MIAEFWIKVEAVKKWHNWNAGHIVAFKKKPYKVGRNEIAMKLSIALPDTLFERPQLEAHIEVPGTSLGQPVINAEVQDNLEQMLSEQIGMTVHISVDEED